MASTLALIGSFPVNHCKYSGKNVGFPTNAQRYHKLVATDINVSQLVFCFSACYLEFQSPDCYVNKVTIRITLQNSHYHHHQHHYQFCHHVHNYKNFRANTWWLSQEIKWHKVSHYSCVWSSRDPSTRLRIHWLYFSLIGETDSKKVFWDNIKFHPVVRLKL